MTKPKFCHHLVLSLSVPLLLTGCPDVPGAGPIPGGGVDAQGKLNVAMVNMEMIYTNFASTGTVSGTATTVNQEAAAGIPRVYFVRL